MANQIIPSQPVTTTQSQSERTVTVKVNHLDKLYGIWCGFEEQRKEEK